jgi:hypothetical protein
MSPLGRGNPPALRRPLEQIFGRLGRRSAYRHGAQTPVAMPLPSVWLTKERQKGWRGEGAERGRARVREACQTSGVERRHGQNSPAPGPGLRSLPLPVPSRRWLQRLHGTSAHRLLAEVPHLRQRVGGRPGWAHGDWCRRSGNVPDAVRTASMAPQAHARDAGCRIEAEAAPPGDTP